MGSRLSLSVKRLGRALYWQLPVSHRTKNKLAYLAYRLFGPAFEGTVNYERWRGQMHRPRIPQSDPLLVSHDAIRDAIEGICFHQVEFPTVSIVIPTYGNTKYAISCLASIAKNPPRASFEVLVVEDASGDADMDQLGAIRGLRYEKNPGRCGFAQSCNRVSYLARGKYLHFVGNGTQVTAGWLDAMLDVFELKKNSCGLVGSKLVYPGGKLQMAGGIVWRDGSVWLYGNRDDPLRGPYNYLRESDYCSAASILLPKELFIQVGGFDKRYTSNCGEDVDLAFKVRKAGLAVFYQPKSVVIHHERILCGINEGKEAKAHQFENRRTVFEELKEVLERDHYPVGKDVLKARDRARNRSVVLVIDQYVPRPDQDAGSRSVFQWMKILCEEGMDVKFWPANLWWDPEYTPLLQQIGIEVFYDAAHKNDFEEWLKESGKLLDYVLLNRPYVSVDYLEPLRRYSRAKLLYYGHDIHHLRIREERRVKGARPSLIRSERALKEIEERVWNAVDVIYYPSVSETEYVQKWLAMHSRNNEVRARTIPLFAFESFQEDCGSGLKDRKGLLFVASFGHAPNIDAAVWFVREVFALIQVKHPDIHLELVGSNPTPEVQSLASHNVMISGYITDEELASRYQRSRVAIVPLRFGAGMKGKVIEAMHFGVPVVTTSTGVQGLEDVADAIAVADDPQPLADHVLRLLSDDALWIRQAEAAVKVAKSRFSVDEMRRVLEIDFEFRRQSPPLLQSANQRPL